MNRGDDAQNTGRLGYRYEWEAVDERPCVYYPNSQFRDEDERVAWERAVLELEPSKLWVPNPNYDPKSKSPAEAYPMLMALEVVCREIASLAAGFVASGTDGFVSTTADVVGRDRRLALLRGQAAGMPSGTEDYS